VGELPSPRSRPAMAVVERLQRLAAELDTSPAVLAVAFALANPKVASVLFGATAPEQIRENARAAQLVERLTDNELAALRAIGA
jgi:aryl-alcohol dehydrogenase-like predicted oxidoreductase